MQTVVEMPEYLRRAKKLGISDDEREDILTILPILQTQETQYLVQEACANYA